MEKIKGKYSQYCDADIARQDDDAEKFVRHNVKEQKLRNTRI
jgi:hypothetical protein